MFPTLRARRDRPGHTALVRGGLALAALLALAATAGAAPGEYKARRFDVTARAVNGGLDVNETITFEFQSGTFTRTWREIPTSRADDITVLDASMDGVPMTLGDGPGRVLVTRRDDDVRVEWHFAEVGPSVHRFDVHYVASGVVYREGDRDVVRWRALPSEHRYRIDASRIAFEPAGAEVRPLETRGLGAASTRTSNEATTIDASDIRTDGWIIAELRYPAGQLIATEPAWRQRAARARALAPRWAAAGAALCAGGLFLLVLMRQGYNPPSGIPPEATATEPPQPLPAALASVLTARGGTSGFQSIATILDLADRGVLSVRERRRGLGRTYELSQVPGTHDLEAHETAALHIAFADGGDDVTLSKARGRLARNSRRFGAAVVADLAARGLIDPDRRAVRGRVLGGAVIMILAAAIAAPFVAALVPRFRGWPFLVPLGLALAAIAGFAVAASITPLSDQGLVEAARWRGFKRHLKSLAASRDDEGSAAVPSRWIVYAIGAGLARQWSRYLKHHPDAAPRWFLSAGDDSGAAFATFVGSHSAGAGGAGAGGGAAGGGGSGAG